MGLSIQEQETTVSFSRDNNICIIYTSDTTIMTKLDKYVENEGAPFWKLKEKHYLQNGELVGKTYETNKKLISFRKDIITRELTDEQKKISAERMKKWREEKKQKTDE